MRYKIYETPEAMQAAINLYFDECKAQDEPVTITGLALALGFNSRQALINYENYSKEFHDTVKSAKLRVENAYEKRLIHRGNGGDVFALKQFDWTDRQDINQNNRFVDETGQDLHAKDKALLREMGIEVNQGAHNGKPANPHTKNEA